MESDRLYTDIIQALATAKQLGRIEERYANRGKANLISKRKATELFGADIVRRYHEQYGIPDATGTKANSTRLYAFTLLNELVEAEKIEEAIVTFEIKVRDHQRRTDRDIMQGIVGKPILLDTLKQREQQHNSPNH